MQTEKERLQCFLYCSANKLGTRPFDSTSLKIDKKNVGGTTVTKELPVLPFSRGNINDSV